MTDAPPDSWTNAEGEYNGKPLFLRLRRGAKTPDRQALFPQRIMLRAKHHNDTPHGMPTGEANEVLNAKGELLHALLETSGLGILVLVLTSDDRREWTYYCNPVPSLQEALQKAVEQSGVKIAVNTAEPEWDEYTLAVGSLSDGQDDTGLEGR
jgi:hypothetical protein